MVFQNDVLVSVIIPVYNREGYVNMTLKNILENKYRPIELILVNDGSKDNSLSVLKQFKEKNETTDFLVKVLDQSNMGAPSARNLGYKNATGNYIQFLDSDDLIHSEKFSLQIPKMQKAKADFCLCDFEMHYTDEKRKVYYSNSKGLKKVLKTHGSFGCGSPLLTRNLANKVSWNVKLKRNQDVDYFLKASLFAEKIVYINQPLYTYIRHSSDRISDSYNKSDPVYTERIRSLKKIFKYTPNKINVIIAMVNLYLSLLRFKMKKLL